MRFLTSFIIFFAILLFMPVSYAIDDVLLDIDGGFFDNLFDDEITDEEWFFDIGGKTLQEKIKEIRKKEVHDISKTHYLLEEILTKHFDKSIVDTMHLFAYYRANASLDFYPDDEDLTYNFNDIDVGAMGRFKDGKSYYEARFRLTPQSNYSFLQYLPSNVYVANTSIPHHTVIVGNTRTATGYEGSKSSAIIPFIARSQISRLLLQYHRQKRLLFALLYSRKIP